MSMLSTRDTVLRDYIELRWGSAGSTPRAQRGISPSSSSVTASELLRSGTTVVTELIITPLQEHETAYVVACSEEGKVGVFDPEVPTAPVMEKDLGARVACTCAVQVPKSGDSKHLSVVVIFTTSGLVYVVASRANMRKWAGEEGLESSLSSSDPSSAGDTPEKSERSSFDSSSFDATSDFTNSTPRSAHRGSPPSSPASPASPASPTSSSPPATPASPDSGRSPQSPAAPASPPTTPHSHSSSIGSPSPRTKVLEGAPPPSPSLPTLDSFEAPPDRRRPSSVGEHRATSPTAQAGNACPFLVLRVHAPQNQLRSTRSCAALGNGELLLGASRTVLRCKLRVQNVAPAAGAGSTPSQQVTLDRLYGWHTRSTVTCVLGTRVLANTNARECVPVSDDEGLSRSRSTSHSGPWALAGMMDGACAVIRSTMDVGGDEGDVFGWEQANASGGGSGWDHVVEYIDTAPGIGSDNMSGGSAEHDMGDASGSSVEFSVVGLGRMAGGTTQHSSSDLAVAIALLDGRVMILGEHGIRCCISVEHQLQCLNCTDVTGDGLNEILVCGLDGATFIIDRHQNVMRYQFPGRVAAFTASRCAIRSGGDVEPCIGMGTFDNRTLIFRQLDISSIGTSTIVGRVQHLFEEYRVLKENTGSLEWTSDEQASLLHSCLYHSVGTSHHITYKCALEQKLKEILAENDALEHRLLEHRKQLRDRA